MEYSVCIKYAILISESSESVGRSEVRIPLSTRGISRVESYQWLKIVTLVATLPGAWGIKVGVGTGWPGVSILWLFEMESLICDFYLSVAARKLV